MSKIYKFTAHTTVFLFVFASFAVLADNAVLEVSPGAPTEIPKSFIRESDLSKARGVLYSQIPDTLHAQSYACQRDSTYPVDADICDDIMPEGYGWRIDSVTTWWYNWNSYISWDSVRYMRFMVYRDSAAASPHPVNSPFINVVVPPSNYTAAEFSTDRCRVDMELPVSVELPGDTIFWIEVQPDNPFPGNGQTGWISAAGVGNGTGFYLRFPEAGYLEWAGAEYLFADSLEVAMVLRGGPVSGIPEDIDGNSEPLLLSVDQLTDRGCALITYVINKSGPATLEIYDILGKSVKTLVDVENAAPGIKTLYWDYKNNKGASVVNGVYMIRLESDNKAATQKLILAR